MWPRIFRRRSAQANPQCDHDVDHPKWCTCAPADESRRSIAKYGWIVVRVPADDINPQDFQYTAGLTERGLPEIIMYGLSMDTGIDIVNDVAQRLCDGSVFGEGEPIHGVVQDLSVQLRKAVRLPDPLGVAWELYRERMSVRQLVWPDAKNRMPWERGFDERCSQPTLYRWAPDGRTAS